MAEEVTTSTRARKPSSANAVSSQDAEQTTSVKVTEYRDLALAADMRGFIERRRSELYKPRLGGQIGGASAINAQSENIVLNVLEHFAEWLENGRPGALQDRTEADLAFYREVRARGIQIEIPPEIFNQL